MVYRKVPPDAERMVGNDAASKRAQSCTSACAALSFRDAVLLDGSFRGFAAVTQQQRFGFYCTRKIWPTNAFHVYLCARAQMTVQCVENGQRARGILEGLLCVHLPEERRDALPAESLNVGRVSGFTSENFQCSH